VVAGKQDGRVIPEWARLSPWTFPPWSLPPWRLSPWRAVVHLEA